MNYGSIPDDILKRNIQTVMLMEYGMNLCGGVGFSTLMAFFVKGAIGTRNDLYTISGANFNPKILVSIIRLFIMVYTLVTYILWICIGMETLDNYLFYRRLIYYSYTVLSGLVSPILFHISLNPVIKKLSQYYKENNEELPVPLLSLKRLEKTLTKSFSVSLGIIYFLKAFANDHLQNYLVVCQITTTVLYFYSSSIFASYPLMKTYPRLLGFVHGRSKLSSQRTNPTNLVKLNGNVNTAAEPAKETVILSRGDGHVLQ
ncbi:hypothetical protein HDV01_000928 [Terramyces sp. JEL0728]|nr:hypothetical protein HDV01_000928 [Terramyces sp. JEL0728]